MVFSMSFLPFKSLYIVAPLQAVPGGFSGTGQDVAVAGETDAVRRVKHYSAAALPAR